MSKSILPRGKCKVCGKIVSLTAPTGDYLDSTRPRKHKDGNGNDCEGRWDDVEEWIKDEKGAKR